MTTIVSEQLGWTEVLDVRASVSGADDLTTRRHGEPFQPIEVECRFRRTYRSSAWELRAVVVTGPRRLASGNLSNAQVLRTWTGASLTDLPGWLRQISDKALGGANGQLPVMWVDQPAWWRPDGQPRDARGRFTSRGASPR